MSENSRPEARPEAAKSPAPITSPQGPTAAPKMPNVPPAKPFSTNVAAPSFPANFGQRKSRKHVAWGIGGFIAGLLAAGLVAVIVDVASESMADPMDEAQQTLAHAANSCELDDSSVATIADDGNSVSFDEVGLLDDDGFDELHCLGDSLGMPDSVTDEMAHTRALDGRQEDEWGNYRVTWSYHPDDGMNAVFSIHMAEAQ